MLNTFKNIGREYGFNATVAKNVNNDIKQRIQNGDTNISIGDILAVTASQYLLTGLDKWSFESIVKSTKLQDFIGKAFKAATPDGKANFLKRIASYATTVAVDGGKEGVQEYLQTWGEILNQNVGVSGKQSNIAKITISTPCAAYRTSNSVSTLSYGSMLLVLLTISILGLLFARREFD